MPQMPPCLHCGAAVSSPDDDFCSVNCCNDYYAAECAIDETLDLESDYDPYAGDYDYGQYDQYDEPDCPW